MFFIEQSKILSVMTIIMTQMVCRQQPFCCLMTSMSLVIQKLGGYNGIKNKIGKVLNTYQNLQYFGCHKKKSNINVLFYIITKNQNTSYIPHPL